MIKAFLDDRGYNPYSVRSSLMSEPQITNLEWVFRLSLQPPRAAERKTVFANHRITKQMSHLSPPICSAVSYPVRVLVRSITWGPNRFR